MSNEHPNRPENAMKSDMRAYLFFLKAITPAEAIEASASRAAGSAV